MSAGSDVTVAVMPTAARLVDSAPEVRSEPRRLAARAPPSAVASITAVALHTEEQGVSSRDSYLFSAAA